LASEASGLSQPATSSSGAAIIARQDRIPVWSFPPLFLVIISIGTLFTFYDISDINVSFIQTCTQIIAGCTPASAAGYIGLPTLLNLIGYIVGALALSPFADRFGRRNMLLITLLLTGIGSIYTAFVGDYANFIIARTITGIGIGADLAIVNTYISEVAPVSTRGKYISLNFIVGGVVGSLLGIWLALALTTPAAPFPDGLPFAIATVAGPVFQGPGWRIIYGIGAALAIIGVLLRFELPESPRWLVSVGRLEEADRTITKMEQRASKRISELPAVPEALPVTTSVKRIGYGEILGNSLYLRRALIVLILWLLVYAATYSIVSGGTVIMVALGYAPSVAGLLVAIGALGQLVGGYLATAFAERIERQIWMLIAALTTLLGGIITAAGGHSSFTVALIGIFLIWIGIAIFIPISYVWSAENFPTRARAVGFALGDGIGHIGGGIAVLVVTLIIGSLGAWGFFILLGVYYLVASGVARLGTITRNKRLDEVSP
jgi:MFS transporter, putative metabolite:H+ symporter